MRTRRRNGDIWQHGRERRREYLFKDGRKGGEWNKGIQEELVLREERGG